MRFVVADPDVQFEIPDDWWSFCDVERWKRRSHYYPYCVAPDRTAEVLPLAAIEPPTRVEGVPQFRKYKLVPVILAFQSPECELPPIEITRNSRGSSYPYVLQNGFHRFYASVAAGYTHIAAVVYERSAV